MPDTPQDGADLLARIKPRLNEDWYGICLRPDLSAAFEEVYSDYLASKAADQARPDRAGSKGTSAETDRLKQEADQIRDQIVDAEVRFVFRGLPRDAFRALCDAHPPRKDDQYDAFIGYNRQAVSDDLVRASLVDPVFDGFSRESLLEAIKDGRLAEATSGAAWTQLLEVVGAGQWDKLRDTADKVNGAVVQAPPKALLA